LDGNTSCQVIIVGRADWLQVSQVDQDNFEIS
jgi:hypothetical protein